MASRSIYCLTALLVAGCAGPAPVRAEGGPASLRCLVVRSWRTNRMMAFLGTFEMAGHVVSRPELRIDRGEWATIALAPRRAPPPSDGAAWSWGQDEDGPRLVPGNGIDTGAFLAVKCEEGRAGKVRADVRAYYVDSGEIIWRLETEQELEPWEEHVLHFTN